MPDPGRAERMLDLQVEWVLDQLRDESLAGVLARDVADFWRLGRELTVADVVDVELAKQVAWRAVEVLTEPGVIEQFTDAVADSIYRLPVAEDHLLGEVVGRERVEALVDTALGLTRMQDQAMSRLAESELAGAVAARFVTKLVSDVLASNRQLAERVPGMSSLLSIGLGAASKVRTATVDQFLGDAVGKGGQFAVRRTNGALREVMRDAPLKEAAMQVWDLHAAEPVSALRAYLSAEELRAVVGLVRDLVTEAGGTEFAAQALDSLIDELYAATAELAVADVLDRLGVDPDEVTETLTVATARIVGRLADSGELEALVRARLAPFFDSAQVRELLEET